MIQEAEEYADTDRLKRERVEKRNRAEALTFRRSGCCGRWP
jgi:molecular chaperone DnaK